LTISGVWIYGAKAMIGSEYDFLSSGLFLIMGIACLEDFTFLSSQQLIGWSWKKSMRKLMVPSFLTSLLTMIGFLSLMTSDIGLISSFGFWSAMGALIEFAMLYGALPAILILFRKNNPIWVQSEKAHLRNWISTMKVKAIPPWIAKASLIVFPIAYFSFSMINPDDTMSHIFPQKHEFNQGLNELEAAKHWRGSVMLVMHDKVPLEEVDDIAMKIKNDPRLQANIVDTETPGKIVKWLANKNVLQEDQVKDDYIVSRTRKQLIDKKDVPRALLFVRDVSVLNLQKIKSVGNEICGNRCHMGGDLIAYSDIAAEIPKTLIDSMAASIALVAGVLGFIAIALRRTKHLLVMLLSSFWGPCLMVIMMAVLHIPMDFLKCIFASTLVGLAGDNAIQYLYASEEESLHDGIEEHGGASIQTALLMACTCLLYLGSYFDPPKTFGLIMAAGLVAGLVGDLWLLNGLLPQKKKPVKD
jgi:predicted RND superfamily exporter protein